MPHRNLLVSISAIYFAFCALPVHGNLLDWTGDGGNSLWNDSVNWFDLDAPPFPQPGHDKFPFGDNFRVAGFTDVARISNGDTVDVALDSNVTAVAVNALTINGGSGLRTNEIQTFVQGNDPSDGLTTISGSDSFLAVTGFGSNQRFTTERLAVMNGAEVEMANAGFVLTESAVVDGNSVLRGNGTLLLNATATYNNNGAIVPESGDLIFKLGGPSIDLDGSSGNGAVTVTQGTSSLILSSLADPFSGTMSIGNGNSIAIVDGWSFDGDLTMTGGTIGIGQFRHLTSGDTQVMSGTNLISEAGEFSGGTLTVDSGATLTIGKSTTTALVIVQPAMTMNSDGLLILESGTLNSANIGGGGTVRFNGTVTINGNTSINTQNLDWDGTGSTTIVNANSELTINSNRIETSNEGYDGIVTLNSGNAKLTVNTDTAWNLEGIMNLGGGARVQGSAAMGVGNGTDLGTINTTGGNSILATVVNFQNGARINVLASTQLTLSNHSRFESGSIVDLNGILTLGGDAVFTGTEWSGGGTLQISSPTAIQAGTSIDVATITIRNAGQVTMDGGVARARVLTKTLNGTLAFQGGEIELFDGDSSLNSDFAYGGNAQNIPELRLVDGAQLTYASTWSVGDELSSHGVMLVDGANTDGSRRSTLRGTQTSATAALMVGRDGEGTLRIENGGLVEVLDNVRIGDGPQSQGEISVRGGANFGRDSVQSDLNILGSASDIVVAEFGTAVLNVENGGRVRIGDDILVAWKAGSNATVNVGGFGFSRSAELDVTDDVLLAPFGTGRIDIGPGGRFSADQVIIGEAGTLNLTGGSTTARRIDTLITGASFDMTGGRLQVDEFRGDLQPLGGTVAPGDSAGATNVTGNYIQGNGVTLEIEIGGTSPGEFDLLSVDSSVILNGTLDVTFVDIGGGTFAPSLGNAFEVVKAVGGIAGTFESENLPSLSGGLAWNIDYGLNSVILEIMDAANIDGDFNDDGTVDAADYTVWRDNVGAPAGTLPNDPSGTVIGTSQYDTWASNFGASSAGLAVQIPEPRSYLLLLWSSTALLRLRRRRRWEGETER